MRGRPRSSMRVFVEHCAVLDVARVPFEQMEADHKRGGPIPAVWLTATRPDGRYSEQRIDFTTTVPHYGGVRYWLVCPNCDQRAGKLYAQDESSTFACRSCLRLAYHSEYRKGGYWTLLRGGREHLASPPGTYHYTPGPVDVSEIDLANVLKSFTSRIGP